MLIQLLPLLLFLISVLVTGILMGVLSVQQVYAHIRPVKLLLMGSFIGFIGINFILLLMRTIPFDEASADPAVRGIFTLSLYIWCLMGLAATIIYCRPCSSSWSDVIADIAGNMRLPLASYMIMLLFLFILSWASPMNLVLRSYFGSGVGIYAPKWETPYMTLLFVGSAVFISYPTAVFLIASRAAGDSAASQTLKTFAISSVGLALSSFLQPIFLCGGFGEVADMIRIPSLILVFYAFRRINALQSFYDVELREYMRELAQWRIRHSRP